MKIGVAREIKPDEYRVALTPAGARELVQKGHEVLIEAAAGDGSSFPDEDEVVEIERWSVDDVESRLGEIEDAKTLVGLLLYLRRRSSTS